MNAHEQTHLITDSIARRVSRLALIIACLEFSLTGNAATYYVGTCKPGKADFATIQQAVTTVPPGSTIDICPGNYPEWVYITQPLTLQGILSGDSAAATIRVPPGSPGKTVDLTPAQVLVVDPGGPVNLNGIIVDGSGFPNNLGYAAAGIFYVSASGTMDHVIVQNLDQNFSQPPSGPFQMNAILVQDDFSVAPTVTIKNSMVSFPAYRPIYEAGILAQSGNMYLSITNNSFSLTAPLNGSGGTGIVDESSGTSTISNNRISATFIGISFFSGTFAITGNTVIGADVGVWDSGTTSATISGNDLFDLTGILAIDQNETIKNNQIYGSPFLPVLNSTQTVGISLDCVSPPAAISGNTFVGLAQALQDVPSGVSLQGTAGTYFGVQTIETICP